MSRLCSPSPGLVAKITAWLFAEAAQALTERDAKWCARMAGWHR